MKKEQRKIDSKFGSFIRSIVSKTGLTHEELSELLGVSTRTMDFYCTGERRPKHERLMVLIKISGGITADEIPFCLESLV